MSAILGPTQNGHWMQQLQQDLIAGLQDGDPDVRLANLARLGGLRLRSSSEALHEFIEYGNEPESKWATYAALRSRDLSALPAVESILINIDTSQAGNSPYRWPPLDAAPSFQDPEELIAFEIQRELRDPQAVPALVKILHSAKSSLVRDCVLQALGDIKDPSSLPELIDHLDDESPLLQYRALTAIYTTTGASECGPPGETGANVQAVVETCKNWWQGTGIFGQWAKADPQ
jgi:HEAT repeat protein